MIRNNNNNKNHIILHKKAWPLTSHGPSSKVRWGDVCTFLIRLNEIVYDVNGQRENNSRVLFCRDGAQCLEVSQLWGGESRVTHARTHAGTHTYAHNHNIWNIMVWSSKLLSCWCSGQITDTGNRWWGRFAGDASTWTPLGQRNARKALSPPRPSTPLVGPFIHITAVSWRRQQLSIH